MNADQLRAKWPTFKIKHDPDAVCPLCRGTGERRLRTGSEVPCWCVIVPHDRVGLMREMAGRVAKQMKRDFPWLEEKDGRQSS